MMGLDMITVIYKPVNEFDVWDYWNRQSPKITNMLRNLEDKEELLIPNCSKYASRLRGRARYWGRLLGCKFVVRSLRTSGGGYSIRKVA